MQQRPITARDNVAPLFFLDGRKREIEMEDCEQLQRAGRGFEIARCKGRIHAVTIWSRDKASLAAGSALSRDDPVVNTIAADGRLSPAGGITSPGFAVTTISSTPAIWRAS